MDNSITHAKREELKKIFHNSKKPIQAMLKQYKYQQDISHAENMKKLCACLESVMNTDCIQDFSKYLSHEENLPIQINFKALRYEYLAEIYEDWLASKQDNSINLERAFTHQHRNILFKRVFLQQKQTIKDYFQTLSSKLKLKGMDLFQLLTELLGPLYLYEFNHDTETFFQKINSFEHFTEVVESYISNARRIYVKDKNDPNDQSYIRLHEFQSLIQFWESYNPELTIQDAPRKNMNDEGVQTNSTSVVTIQTQTDKQTERSYLNILNNALHQINGLISRQNDPELLSSLDKVFDVLRTQKMFAVSYQAKYNEKRLLNRPNNQLFNKVNSSGQRSETERMFIFEKPKNSNSPIRSKTSPRKISINTEQYERSPVILPGNGGQQDEVKVIYRYLCNKDNLHCLTLNQLQIFFYNLGLTEAHENYLVHNLLNYRFIQDKDEISLKQFKSILRQLMKQNKKFNMGTLKLFINTFIEVDSMTKTAYFKNNSPRNNSPKNNPFSKINGSNKKSHVQDRVGQISSRTTYQMDSEGSNI